MQDPIIAKIWKTVFGKEFGGLAQGDHKTQTIGSNEIFVMTHNDIQHLAGTKYTYAHILLDHHPQKVDPNRICITAGGNLINYNKELSV